MSGFGFSGFAAHFPRFGAHFSRFGAHFSRFGAHFSRFGDCRRRRGRVCSAAILASSILRFRALSPDPASLIRGSATFFETRFL